MPKKRYYGKSKGEMMGSSIMPSGQGAFANMFQGSFMKSYPTTAHMTSGSYPDTPRAIDGQISGVVSSLKRNPSDMKF